MTPLPKLRCVLSLLLAPLAFAAQSPVVPIPEQERAAGRQMCDGAMRPNQEVARFKHSDRWFPSRRVARSGPVRALTQSNTPLPIDFRFEANGKQYDLYDYLAVNRIAGLLILKNGRIALEDYELGTGPATHWPSFSIAKSVSSTLVGAALEDGFISSLDDPLTNYLPVFKNTAYDGVTIRNVLQMASGVRWDETYTAPQSDSRSLYEAQFLQNPGATLLYMSRLPRAAPPGSVWNYSTGETYVVGALIEAATHRPLATYLSEKIWSRAGMADDATWSLETPNGMGLGGTGLAATLRDFGRLGLVIQQDGIIGGKRLVPQGWFETAGSAKVIAGKPVDYGYLWWPLPQSDPIHQSAFQAIGIFGQHVYINPKQSLVIVELSARPKPTGSTVIDDNAFFAAVANALNR